MTLNHVTDQGGMAALDFAKAAWAAALAAALAGVPCKWSISSAGSAPLSSAAQPASETLL